MAIDYTEQEWFDDTKSWKENFDAFLEAQKYSTYSLGDFSGSTQGDQDMYTDLKIKTAQEAKKKEDFYKARDQAFADFEAQKSTEKQALADEWQTYEDNDYTIPQ